MTVRPETPARGGPAIRRLAHSAQFDRIYRERRRRVGRFLVLWRAPASERSPAVGVVAGRRVGGAVQRNRAKRRLRAAVQAVRARWPDRFDIVLVARPAILEAAWPDVLDELAALAGCSRAAASAPPDAAPRAGRPDAPDSNP